MAFNTNGQPPSRASACQANDRELNAARHVCRFAVSLLPLTAKIANGTVAQIYAEVRKTRALTQVSIEICIHR